MQPPPRNIASSLALAIALVGLSVHCGTTIAIPTRRHADWAALQWPGTQLADLERGRELYALKCSGCHTLYAPEQFAAAHWRQMMGEMAERAQLEHRERDAIERYLVTMATVRGADSPRRQALR